MVDEFVELMQRPDFRRELIDDINSQLDIPLLSETHEERLFAAIYDCVCRALTRRAEERAPCK